jgi:glutamyl-Q tRNA(Asp) synthetase
MAISPARWQFGAHGIFRFGVEYAAQSVVVQQLHFGRAATLNVSGYVGRFAPSPTGPLHFGSLLAAMASYADALAHDGKWLVRIEDVDEPRSAPGASAHILRTLSRYGFRWDGEVIVQSERTAIYEAALKRLDTCGAVFACYCTRKMLETQPQNVSGERLYPGTCLRDEGKRLGHGERSAFALRVNVPEETITWNDRLLGEQSQRLASEVGAFIVKRSDRLFAYQLAVVVDDAAQGMTHVVRGADLLSSTPRQIYLQRLLGVPTPAYLHIPVAVNGRGEKLSKQTQAPALSETEILPTLVKAWQALFQLKTPETAPQVSSVGEFWAHAAQAWSVARLPRMQTLPEIR